ncbi:MAG: cytidine deaminase [Bacteroidetes bacterium]|nr:MAG: cytidine deaminase [Bacteroidota bacterium]
MMKQQSLHIVTRIFGKLGELPERDINLVNRALEAAREAFAPYSGYHVGAALLLAGGEIVTGNNQENVAFPSGLCAERVALFYAGSRYPGLAVIRMAIVAMKDGIVQESPVTPCGACRQVMIEQESRGGLPMEVILYGSREIRVIERAADLLPFPFIHL